MSATELLRWTSLFLQQYENKLGHPLSINIKRVCFAQTEYLIAVSCVESRSWFKVPRQWLRILTKPSDKLTLISLFNIWNLVGQPNWFFASQEQLAIDTGLDVKTLRASLRRLRNLGGIETKPPTRELATRYRFKTLFTDALASSLKTSPFVGGEKRIPNSNGHGVSHNEVHDCNGVHEASELLDAARMLK